MRTHVSQRQPMPGYPLIAALILAVLLALLLLFLPPLSSGQRIAVSSAVRGDMLVSTGWLERHLNDSGVVVLHIGGKRADYDSGHIPGARFLPWSDIVVSRDKLTNELPPAADLKRVFQQAGVGDQTRVILYGEHSGLMAARAYFTLDYLGHGERAALLDGGLEKWKAEKRTLSTETPAVTPANFTARILPELLVHLPQVQDLSWQAANEPSPAVVLIDARAPEEYSGEKPGDGVPRAGHIPGAVSLYWMKTLESKDDLQILPPYELRKLFQQVAQPGTRLVAYCRSGVQASYLYFTAKYLGYDVALYDGSFLEWSASDRTSVVRAEQQH